MKPTYMLESILFNRKLFNPLTHDVYVLNIWRNLLTDLVHPISKNDSFESW